MSVIISETTQLIGGFIKMNYDFTTQVSRKNTGSHKWNLMYDQNPSVEEGICPLSVADMEFKNPPEVYQGLIKYLESEPILGYTGPTEEYLEAVINWQERRHHWAVKKDWIVTTPGVVAALNVAIRSFSEEEDGIIIFQPVYHPFENSILANNRTLVNVPLLNINEEYTIDFKSFEEEAAKPENKMLIFCSPHNPVGRVWQKAELEQLAEIAIKHDLTVVSDEIWHDFVREDKEHTVLHTVNSKLQDHLITCTSASKTFNLAGVATSNIIISNDEMRQKFSEEAQKSSVSGVNVFGFEATKIVYTECEDWFEELNHLIYENQQMVKEFFEENYPKIKAPVSEGTYVQWLDFSALEMPDKDLEAFLHEHQFFTNAGYTFGKEGSGFQRINVALPKKALEKLLDGLLEALLTRDKQINA